MDSDASDASSPPRAPPRAPSERKPVRAPSSAPPSGPPRHAENRAPSPRARASRPPSTTLLVRLPHHPSHPPPLLPPAKNPRSLPAPDPPPAPPRAPPRAAAQPRRTPAARPIFSDSSDSDAAEDLWDAPTRKLLGPSSATTSSLAAARSHRTRPDRSAATNRPRYQYPRASFGRRREYEYDYEYSRDDSDVDAELAEEVAAYREYLRERDAARSFGGGFGAGRRFARAPPDFFPADVVKAAAERRARRRSESRGGGARVVVPRAASEPPLPAATDDGADIAAEEFLFRAVERLAFGDASRGPAGGGETSDRRERRRHSAPLAERRPLLADESDDGEDGSSDPPPVSPDPSSARARERREEDPGRAPVERAGRRVDERDVAALRAADSPASPVSPDAFRPLGAPGRRVREARRGLAALLDDLARLRDASRAALEATTASLAPTQAASFEDAARAAGEAFAARSASGSPSAGTRITTPTVPASVREDARAFSPSVLERSPALEKMLAVDRIAERLARRAGDLAAATGKPPEDSFSFVAEGGGSVGGGGAGGGGSFSFSSSGRTAAAAAAGKSLFAEGGSGGGGEAPAGDADAATGSPEGTEGVGGDGGSLVRGGAATRGDDEARSRDDPEATGTAAAERPESEPETEAPSRSESAGRNRIPEEPDDPDDPAESAVAAAAAAAKEGDGSVSSGGDSFLVRPEATATAVSRLLLAAALGALACALLLSSAPFFLNGGSQDPPMPAPT